MNAVSQQSIAEKKEAAGNETGIHLWDISVNLGGRSNVAVCHKLEVKLKMTQYSIRSLHLTELWNFCLDKLEINPQ